MMPTRRRTRAHARTQRVSAERYRNRLARTARRTYPTSYFGPAPPDADNDPPPF